MIFLILARWPRDSALRKRTMNKPAPKNFRPLIFGGPDLDFDKLSSFIVNPDTYPTFQDIQNKVQAAAGA